MLERSDWDKQPLLAMYQVSAAGVRFCSLLDQVFVRYVRQPFLLLAPNEVFNDPLFLVSK